MNGDDLGRRRRLTPSDSRRSSGGGNGWLITIVAAIVVVIAGWFLGMALARFANAPKKPNPAGQIAASPTASPTQAPTPAPSPTSTPRATPKPKPTATAKATPAGSPSPSASPSPRPTASPTPRATIAPTIRPTVAPTPQRRTIPVIRRPEPTPRRTAAPPPVSVPSNAAEVAVRSYIEALRSGDPQTAASYLGNGAPDEGFIDANTRILSMSSAREADGSYVVAVQMQTPRGTYQETFNVSSTADGYKILQKSVTRL